MKLIVDRLKNRTSHKCQELIYKRKASGNVRVHVWDAVGAGIRRAVSTGILANLGGN